jgi:hypothetical protein
LSEELRFISDGEIIHQEKVINNYEYKICKASWFKRDGKDYNLELEKTNRSKLNWMQHEKWDEAKKVYGLIFIKEQLFSIRIEKTLLIAWLMLMKILKRL